MRVLHFLPWHSPRTKGGTEVFLLRLAQLQRAHGDDVEIIGPNDSKTVAQDCIDGIKVTYFPYPYEGIGEQESRSASKRESQRAFLELVDAIGPNVIHLHGIDHFFQSFFQPITARQTVSLCLTVHLINVVCPNQTLITEENNVCTRAAGFSTCARCISSQRHRSWLSSLAESISIPLSDFLIRRWQAPALAEGIPYQRSILRQMALLDFLRDNVRIDVLNRWFYDVLMQNGFASDRVRIRPNPLLNSDTMTPRPPRPTDRGRRMKFVFVGRLSTEKGLWLLIEALQGLEDLKNQLEITLVGRHDEPAAIRALCGLRDRGFDLNFPGEVPTEAVDGYLRRSDYLVFPSSAAEMAPMVIQEALEKELPVICSDLPSATAFIRDGLNGLVFARNNASDLRRVMRSVLERDYRMGFDFHPEPNLDHKVYSHYRTIYGDSDA